MGPCTDLEFKGFIGDSGVMCKCGKNDCQLRSDQKTAIVNYNLKVVYI